MNKRVNEATRSERSWKHRVVRECRADLIAFGLSLAVIVLLPNSQRASTPSPLFGQDLAKAEPSPRVPTLPARGSSGLERGRMVDPFR
jgi:hypothetical protein